jgi:hypothetical protein
MPYINLELGYDLPKISPPKGNYISYHKTGNLVFLSGNLLVFFFSRYYLYYYLQI